MNADAALDELAFQVSLLLMGPDGRRRLRIAALSDPRSTADQRGPLDWLERVEALASGTREPETLQDFVDLKAAERARYQPPFDPGFWAQCVARLVRAGFDESRAGQLVSEVQHRIVEALATQEEPECSEA